MYSIQIAGFSVFVSGLELEGEPMLRWGGGVVGWPGGGGVGRLSGFGGWASGQAHHPSMAFAARTAPNALGECF